MKTLFLLSFFLLTFSGSLNQIFGVEHKVAISKDSERIAYSTYGSGATTLIFIHGWSCDSRYWEKQFSEFEKDFRVIAIDLAAHGNSSSNRVDYTMLSFAEDIKAVIEKESVDNAVLIGHSMGGGVIAEAGRLIPNKVVALIGVDNFNNITEVVPQEVIDGMINPFKENFRETMEGFVVPMLPNNSNPQLINWIIEDMSSAHKDKAISAVTNYLGQYKNGEALKVIEDIDIPLVSINCKLWPTEEDINRKYFKNYKLLYIEGTGHFPMLEKPEEFNKLLREALKHIETVRGK